jgi:6-phosphogluconolactonase
LPTIVYAAAGNSLRVFSFDPQTGALEQGGVTDVRTDVHYAAMHPSRKYLYAAVSDRAQVNLIYVFGVDTSTGELSQLDDPFSTSSRAVHVTVDRTGRYLLTANNLTESVDVLRLGSDGRVRELVVQPGLPKLGFLVHQIRVDLTNRWVFVPVRGNDGVPELIGRLHVFSFDDGVLKSHRTIDYEAGIGPRHLDFHPTQPWLYVLTERGNQLITYKHDAGALRELFRTTTLRDRSFTFPAQRAGAIHVHPNGRWVYVTNRNVEAGENTIAFFEIDAQTGEPARVEHVDSHGFEPRTFTIDTTANVVIVANMMNVDAVLPNLSIFRIANDGRLTFVRSHDQPVGGPISWVGHLANETSGLTAAFGRAPDIA